MYIKRESQNEQRRICASNQFGLYLFELHGCWLLWSG